MILVSSANRYTSDFIPSGKSLNPEKCKHMNIARVEKTDEFKHKLSGKNIERVQKEKDIGVTIDQVSR
jgi:hypothetical protein